MWFTDIVPLTVDHELLRGFQAGFHEGLVSRLVASASIFETATEDSDTKSARSSLKAQLANLESWKVALMELA